MAKAVIAYDKGLPGIPGRRPWERPTQHLVKGESAPTGWAVAEGRRPSRLLLSSLSSPGQAPQLLMQGYEELQRSAEQYPRHAAVCRLQFAYAVALPPTSAHKQAAQHRASACREHWLDSRIFEFLHGQMEGTADDRASWPGLEREVALWKIARGLGASRGR